MQNVNFSSLFFSIGRPEPTVTWFSGTTPLKTGGGVSMGRHVTVNRLEIPHIKRDALNTTYVCQASNTKLVPPAERTVRVEMLCEYSQSVTINFLLSFFGHISKLFVVTRGENFKFKNFH